MYDFSTCGVHVWITTIFVQVRKCFVGSPNYVDSSCTQSAALLNISWLVFRASRVCRLWKEVAEQASLWNDVDLSFGWIKHKESTLTWLCSNRLSGVRRLNLTSWRKLTSEQLQVCVVLGWLRAHLLASESR